jgi:serine/threonine protein kinase
LQHIHSRNFIHRDLKPSNIVMGSGKQASVVYLIDFGLSKQFRDPNTHRHIPYIDAIGFTGSAIFASIHSHLGRELGRRDDLESLAYILIYFLRGSLPWQGLGHLDIAKNKEEISSLELCHGFPVEFGSFLDYSRSLLFDAKPDYHYLFDLFNNLLLQQGVQGLEGQHVFDWEAVEGGQLGGNGRPSHDEFCSHRGQCSPKRRVGYVLILVRCF